MNVVISFHSVVYITPTCIFACVYIYIYTYILQLTKYIVVFRRRKNFFIGLELSHDRIYFNTPCDLKDGCVCVHA